MKAFVLNNFVDDFEKERNLALQAKYETINHNGLTYKGICFTDNKEQDDKINSILGFGGTIKSMWRRYLSNEENETYIHTDCDIGTFTAILFLNTKEQSQGGIALWKHRKYGWEAHPTKTDLLERGIEETPEFFATLYQDGFDESLWDMVEYVPMASNRLVVFDSRRFHSRYPKKSFGSSLEDGRLIKVFFLTC